MRAWVVAVAMAVTTRSTLHYRLFGASVFWTLGLLLLGSIVHATESSLACPDWPTCFGTMVPEMVGGVFWEHLHRLVAGGLVVLWALATWLAYRERQPRAAIRYGAVAGLLLLIVQSVFGGLTVLMRLPDAISTTHLGLAFLFLALATGLTVETHPRRSEFVADERSRRVRRWVVAATVLVFVQSVVGALVRHTDSGLACPDVPLCLGELVPPLEQWPIVLHFAHRALGGAVVAVVLAAGVVALRQGRRPRLLALASLLVVAQAILGFASVLLFLEPWTVSLHTLLAACLLATLVCAATLLTTPSGFPVGAVERARPEELTRG